MRFPLEPTGPAVASHLGTARGVAAHAGTTHVGTAHVGTAHVGTAPGERPPPLPHVTPPRALRLRGTLWRVRFLVAAVCLGAAAGVVVQALRPAPAPTVAVVVLARDVAAGTTLTAADVALARLPPDVVPAGAFTDPGPTVGRATAVDLPAHQVLGATLLVEPGLGAPVGAVVAAVRLDDPAVAGLLVPGLHVDLVAARPEGGDGTTVARRALVLPLPDGATHEPGGLLGGAGTGTDDGAPVLVAVTPTEAVAIAQASASSRLVAVVVP